MSNQTDTEVQAAKKKPGRKPSPLTSAQQQFVKAKSKADKARLAHQKVDHIAAKLHEAEKEETEAYEALQQVLEEMKPSAFDGEYGYND